MPGLIKDQRCSDRCSAAPPGAGVSIACNRRSPSVTLHYVQLCCAEKNIKIIVKWFFQGPTAQVWGCSQQVALVETENVLKEISSYTRALLRTSKSFFFFFWKPKKSIRGINNDKVDYLNNNHKCLPTLTTPD